MHKKILLIFLFCLSTAQHLIADIEKTHIQRLETIYAQYNDYQKVISNSPERDIILLQNHMTELQEEKNELNSFYNKKIKPVFHRLNATVLGILTFGTIGSMTESCKKHYDNKKSYDYILMEIFKDTSFGTVTGLLCKYCIKCASYPANKTKEINAAITRDQIIIAQLQKQIKLKENNA